MRVIVLCALALVACSNTEEAAPDCSSSGCWLNKPDDSDLTVPIHAGNVGVCLAAISGDVPYCYQGCSASVACGPAEVCVPLDREPANAPRAAGVCFPVAHAESCRGAYLYEADDTPAYDCRGY